MFARRVKKGNLSSEKLQGIIASQDGQQGSNGAVYLLKSESLSLKSKARLQCTFCAVTGRIGSNGQIEAVICGKVMKHIY